MTFFEVVKYAFWTFVILAILPYVLPTIVYFLRYLLLLVIGRRAPPARCGPEEYGEADLGKEPSAPPWPPTGPGSSFPGDDPRSMFYQDEQQTQAELPDTVTMEQPMKKEKPYAFERKRKPLLRAEGILVTFGMGKHPPKKAGGKPYSSFYADVDTSAGNIRCIGVDVERVLADIGAKPGDRIILEKLGSTPVTITDESGNSVTTSKNLWDGKLLSR